MRCRLITSPSVLNSLSRRYKAGRTVRASTVSGVVRYQLALDRWLSDLRPDGVVALGFRAQLALAALVAARRLPTAWIAADFIPTDTLICKSWSLLAGCLPRVVITYSLAAAAQPALCHADTCVVQPGIEHGQYPLGAEKREPLLALVGHLTPLKNHLGFVQVLRRVREAVPEAKGVIAGRAMYRTGPHAAYAEQVRAAVDAFAASDVLRLIEAPADGVGPLLRRAALLVHISSVPETFGLACVEAMASGCPVVGFNRGATPEVVGDAGVLVSPDDLEGVAKACIALLKDEARRLDLMHRGRARALANFSADISGATGATAIRMALA